LVLNY
jgi:hypothetical protein